MRVREGGGRKIRLARRSRPGTRFAWNNYNYADDYIMRMYARACVVVHSRRYMYIGGQVKRSREKKGPAKRSRAVLGQSQAVKIDFRRSRILTPVADGPTASTGSAGRSFIIIAQ